MADDIGTLNWRPGTHVPPLPVSLQGVWSPRQAFHVMESMRDQAEAQGLMLIALNVTTFGMAAPRLLVLPVCRRHGDEVVPPGRTCEECQREWPR